MGKKIVPFVLGFFSCLALFVLGFILFYKFILKSQMEYFENDLKVERKESKYEFIKIEGLKPELFTSLDSGEKVDINDFEERIVFINFWATWCGPCIAEMPYFEDFVDGFQKDNIKFLFVSDEEIKKLTKFREKNNYNLPLYKVDSLQNDFFNHQSIPANYIIDKDNNIAFKVIGAANWNKEPYISLVKSIMN